MYFLFLIPFIFFILLIPYKESSEAARPRVHERAHAAGPGETAGGGANSRVPCYAPCVIRLIKYKSHEINIHSIANVALASQITVRICIINIG